MWLLDEVHCVKSVRIQSYSGPHFPPVRMREKTDQSNSEYGHFLRSGSAPKDQNWPPKSQFLVCFGLLTN